MAEFVICPSCGARMRGDRLRCLRCEQPLKAAVSAPEAESFRLSKGQQLIAGVAGSLVLLVGAAVIWESTADVPRAGSAAGPTKGTAPSAVPARPVTTPIATEPISVPDTVRFGNASFAGHDWAAARTRYEQALEKNPDDSAALNGLALVMERDGQMSDARERFARAAELAPTIWAYRFNLAHAAAAMRDWDQAIAEYREAARLFPTDYATQFNLAMTLHKKGDDEAAIPEYHKAIALAPSEPTFHLSLAVSLEKTGNIADARREYQQYLDMEPAAADAPKVKEHLDALAARPAALPAARKPDSTS